MTSRPELDYLQGATGDWELVIGMEVHAQVISKSKLFSGAATEFGAPPNSQVSLIDAAMPGMLPVINQTCIRQAVKTGLGFKAKINLYSVFDRKNYFYPDLPQGYQISQFKYPIVGEGEVELDLEDGRKHKIGIERLHLEQDAGKSVHDQHPDYSLVDLNRSGIGLMEIVSKPDIRSVAQAQAFITKVRTILRYLGTCDGNMEEGSLRADINVSVRRPGDDLGTRCEIKNVNSVRFMGQAIVFEAQRQIDILESGGCIEQETRLFNARNGETRSMRSKEEAHDYRYFPDPDLIPLELSQEEVDEIAASLPELPDEKMERFISDYELSQYDAGVLTAEIEAADYFEGVVTGLDPKLVANWITGELFGALNKLGIEIRESPVSPSQLKQLLGLISDNVISGRIAKDVFEIMLKTGQTAANIVQERGLQQVTDSGAIEKMIDQIIAENPEQVEQIKTRPKTIGWFVGQVMKASEGKANPAVVNEVLRKKLEQE